MSQDINGKETIRTIVTMDIINTSTGGATTGISVSVDVDVGSVNGASTGSETRPKNMNVIYVMRVW